MADQEADEGQKAAQTMKLIWTDLILLIPALLVLIFCLVVGYHGGREDADRARAPPDCENCYGWSPDICEGNCPEKPE